MSLSIEESTTENISLLLEQIVKQIISENNSEDTKQRDLMFVLIIVIFVESGLVPVDNNNEIIAMQSVDSEQLRRWRNSEFYTATFVMCGYKAVSVKVIMSSLGAVSMLNVTVNDLVPDTYTICLPTSRYVVSPKASSIPMIFRDLKHFSTVIKNKILTPVKSKILDLHGRPSASLTGLPVEILHKLYMSLSIRDVLNVSEVCKILAVSVNDNNLWHDLYNRDYGEKTDQNENCVWKEIYKKSYLEGRDKTLRQRLRRDAGTMHDHMDYADYVSYIDNPMWDYLI